MKTTTKTLGETFTYTGSEHRFLTGMTVQIRAIFKGAADLDADVDNMLILDDDRDIERVGIDSDDRVEVAPWIEKAGRFSFATSDALATDLAGLLG